MNSYNIVNYKLRPQKQIERGLLAVLINDFATVLGKDINYVGMGSLLFVDFTFFNKYCRLKRMISIEKMLDQEGNFDKNKEKRFINNKPLDKIELISQPVSDAIDEMPLDENGFIWLDYDGQIETETIDDLERIIEGIQVTCILAITFNGGASKKYKSDNKINLEACERDFEPYRVEDSGEVIPLFNKDNYGMVSSMICEKYLLDKVGYYNDIYGKNLSMERISEVHYSDNAKMTTLVWAIINEEDECANEIRKKFETFEGAGEIRLSMENLTLYEKMRIDRCPLNKVEELATEMGLDMDTIHKYLKYAKYIPEYSEVYY